ncbi:MAG TPA: hypothetical protein ENF78_03150 [Candidatus Bathyarchaeota archaeon]|nr:hypothetical protein [Candidatus Bathyarchaeota archaeon]
MASVSEELMPEVMAEIEAGYRLRPATQVGLMLILTLLGLWLIYLAREYYDVPLEVCIIAGTIYLALLYPLIIKIRNRFTIALSFGFFGAAIAAIAYWLVTNVVLMPGGLSIEAIALYVVFLEIIVMELFHHLCEEYVFYERDWRSYLLTAVLSAGFFACLYVFLSAYALGFTAIVIAAVLTMMFAWAILPEKPI